MNTSSIINIDFFRRKEKVKTIEKDKSTIRLAIEGNKEAFNTLIKENMKSLYIDIILKDYLFRIDSTELYFVDEENNYIHPENTKFNGIDNGYEYTLTLPRLDSSKDYFLPLTPNRNIILEDEKIIINMEDIKN